MKKTIILLALLAFVLIGAAAVLLVQLLSYAPSEQSPAVELESFLAENWSVFQLRSWDAKTGALELDYPLPFSLEQMKKYAGVMEELQAIPEGNRRTLIDLKLALQTFSADSVQCAGF